MSTKQIHTEAESERKSHRNRSQDPLSESEEEEIDLRDDPYYQVLSAVLETDRGRNVAEILSKIQKDVHLLATSVHQLIQLSLAAQQSRATDNTDDDDSESE